LNARTTDVSLTLLSANGQLFRATRLGASRRSAGEVGRAGDADAATLNGVTIRRRDSVHYTFHASGRGPGLVQNATPYVTVELQVGTAVFSNAQAWRVKARRVVYP
jgi:aspartate-semialdehyde dehydrogenase